MAATKEDYLKICQASGMETAESVQHFSSRQITPKLRSEMSGEEAEYTNIIGYNGGAEGVYMTLHTTPPCKKFRTTVSPEGYYKSAVISLGLLCGLLAAIIIGLCFMIAMQAGEIQTLISDFKTTSNGMAAEMEAIKKRTVEARKNFTQYMVDVTFDADTANNYLNLSADGKQVWYQHMNLQRPDNPKRFNAVPIVLGKQGFSSGRFYYEVQVSGKRMWSLGVASESIRRKGAIYLSPKNRYWTIWLKNNKYKALDDPDQTLSLKEDPERIGVFVDYQRGLISFYDADTWDLIYSFEGVSLKETIYPYFCPYTEGKKSPIIINSMVPCSTSQ